MRIHLDTDLGGDPDDACALVMLLAWPGVEITGITTNLDVGGRRAGCVRHVLRLLGRHEVPVAAGAGASLTTGRTYEPTWRDRRYWPEPVEPRPSPPGAGLDLLAASLAGGATVVAIGAQTNLALLEIAEPGTLSDASIVAMAGWIDDPPDGYPQWGPARDWNVQVDTRAAEVVAAATDRLTLVTMPASMRAQLRAADLPRLRGCGPIGDLLALQSEAWAADRDRAALAAAHEALPDDLLNFHWDPVTCAVAAGWRGATVTRRTLRTRLEDGVLAYRDDPDGRPAQVVTDIDADDFRATWLARVEAAASGQGS